MVAAHRRLRSVGSYSVITPTILPVGCIVGVRRAPRGWAPCRQATEEREGCDVDVRIGIVQTVKELEVELADDADREAVMADIDVALGGEGVLWLTDKKGRRVGVPSSKVAYIEVGAPTAERRVGFGAP
jgi:hypothetical protein